MLISKHATLKRRFKAQHNPWDYIIRRLHSKKKRHNPFSKKLLASINPSKLPSALAWNQKVGHGSQSQRSARALQG